MKINGEDIFPIFNMDKHLDRMKQLFPHNTIIKSDSILGKCEYTIVPNKLILDFKEYKLIPFEFHFNHYPKLRFFDCFSCDTLNGVLFKNGETEEQMKREVRSMIESSFDIFSFEDLFVVGNEIELTKFKLKN